MGMRGNAIACACLPTKVTMPHEACSAMHVSVALHVHSMTVFVSQ